MNLMDQESRRTPTPVSSPVGLPGSDPALPPIATSVGQQGHHNRTPALESGVNYDPQGAVLRNMTPSQDPRFQRLPATHYRDEMSDEPPLELIYYRARGDAVMGTATAMDLMEELRQIGGTFAKC